MPPAFAIAIAIADSVTVSIADETNGTDKEIVRVSHVPVFTSLGTTSEASGSNKTSSYVRPSIAIFSVSLLIAALLHSSNLWLLSRRWKSIGGIRLRLPA